MEQNPPNVVASDEETASATGSEFSPGSGCRTQRLLYEQRYWEERARLLLELEQLRQGTHPEYLKVEKRLQDELDDRLQQNEIERDRALAAIERDCLMEHAASEVEYEEKVAELVANAIAALEHERKAIEDEYATMEVDGCADGGGAMTQTARWKLRSRVNETATPEQHRKPMVRQLKFLLEEDEIVDDLGVILANTPDDGERGTNEDGK